MARSIIGAGFDDFVQKQIKIRQEKNQIYSSKGESVLKYQNASTAFLRLTSGVDINNKSDDAKNFQLFSTRFAGLGANGQFASGIGIGETLNTAYGAFSTSEYGYVPPPGLVSADVKAMNRGSLREANVKILAHSSTQFEIIEQLYLRLGYSMLLEWGNSTYFDNKGVYHPNNTHEVYSKFIVPNSMETILDEIRAQRDKSCGNYDAMMGLVKNFSWSLERDGSYSITLSIISTGDVIESLKTNTSHPTSTASTTDSPVDQPPLQYNAEKSTLNKILYNLSKQIPPRDLSKDASATFYLQGNQTTADAIGSLIGLTPNQRHDSSPSAQGDVVGFLFPELNGVNDGVPGFNAQYFIKLGVLLRCLQNFCLLYNPDKSNEAIFSLNSDEEENFCFTYARHGSLDPRVCLVDIDQSLKLDVDPITGVATQPTVPANYVVNDYYYEFKVIEVYQSTNGGAYGTVSEGILGKESSSNPLDITEYVESITLSPGGKADLNKFLTEKIGAIGNVLTKSGPIQAGTINSLDNYPTRENGPYGITLLNKYVGLGIDKATNFETEFQWSGYQKNEPKFPALENTEYLTKVWDLAKEDTSPTVTNTFIRGGQAAVTVTTDTYVKVKTYRIITSTLTSNSTGYTGTGVGSVVTDVQNNLFDKIRAGSRFRVDPDKFPFIGRTMNIYINMNYAAKILQDYVDISTGAIAMYDFLDKLMKGVQHAMGNINNFNVTYDEDKNEFSIVDSTFIPFLNKYKPSAFANPPAEFLTHTLTPTEGSFMRDASIKTQLSNNFKTMVTVGAQANGNAVGSNSTGLAIWNTGLTDRIIKEKTTENDPKDTTTSNVSDKFYSNVGIVQNLYSAINDGNITDQQIEGGRDAGVDLFNYEIGLYTANGIIPSVGFIPINLELTMDGLSGMRIYESYTADTKLLPPRYKDAIQYIITGVSHKIQNNDWTTTIQSISGPKYTNFSGKASAPAIKSHGVTRNKQVKYVPSPPTENTEDITPSTPGGTPGVTRIRVVRSYADQNQVVSRLVLINVDGNGKETVANDQDFWTLECPWLNNQKATMAQQSSCIPLGYYNAEVQYKNKRGKIIRVNGFSDGNKGYKAIKSNGVTRDGILWHPGGNTKWVGLDPDTKRWSIGCLLFATSAIINNKDKNGYFNQTVKSGAFTGYVSNDARDKFMDFLANKMGLTNGNTFDFEVVVAGTGNAANYPKLSIHQSANDKYFG